MSYEFSIMNKMQLFRICLNQHKHRNFEGEIYLLIMHGVVKQNLAYSNNTKNIVLQFL